MVHAVVVEVDDVGEHLLFAWLPAIPISLSRDLIGHGFRVHHCFNIDVEGAGDPLLALGALELAAALVGMLPFLELSLLKFGIWHSDV